MKVKIIDGTFVKGHGSVAAGENLEVPSDVATALLSANRAVFVSGREGEELEVSGVTSPESPAKDPNSLTTGAAPGPEPVGDVVMTAQGPVPYVPPEPSGTSGSPEAGVIDEEIAQENRELEKKERERLKAGAKKPGDRDKPGQLPQRPPVAQPKK